MTATSKQELVPSCGNSPLTWGKERNIQQFCSVVFKQKILNYIHHFDCFHHKKVAFLRSVCPPIQSSTLENRIFNASVRVLCSQLSFQQNVGHFDTTANPSLWCFSSDSVWSIHIDYWIVLNVRQLVPAAVQIEQMARCWEIDSQLCGQRSGLTSSIINGGALSVQLDKSLNMTPG